MAFSHQKAEIDQKQVFLIPEALEKERESFKFRKSLKDVLKITSFVVWGFVSMYAFIFLSFFFQLEMTRNSLSGWEKLKITPTQVKLEKTALNLNQTVNSLSHALTQEKIVSTFYLRMRPYTDMFFHNYIYYNYS